MDNTTIIFGPPGTGKTTKLLRIVEEELERGTPPDRIGYFAFTRKASQEAITRACSKFNIERKQFSNFRTLHSLAYRSLKLDKTNVMKDEHYKDLENILQLRLSNPDSTINTYGAFVAEDIYMQLINLAKVKNEPLNKIFHEFGHVPGGWLKLDYVDRALREYKTERNLFDYTDMIIEYNKQKPDPHLDVLIVDEAQDLSFIQWEMVKNMQAQVDRVYIAGDDDQAIFKWSGAQPEFLINLPGKREILNQSFRVPIAVHRVANSLVSRIENRVPKDYRPNPVSGFLERHVHRFDSVDLKHGSWLLLGRTNYIAEQLVEDLRGMGVYYEKFDNPSVSQKLVQAIRTWEALQRGEQANFNQVKNLYSYLKLDKDVARGHKGLTGVDEKKMFNIATLSMEHGLKVEQQTPWHYALTQVSETMKVYVLSLLRNQEEIDLKPRIKVSTIHGAKGGEADNVMLCTDITKRVEEGYLQNPDDERRVFYVGATRAKQSLHLVASQSNLEFSEIFR